jgi:outer membrane protein, heavy metal efflux system
MVHYCNGPRGWLLLALLSVCLLTGAQAQPPTALPGPSRNQSVDAISATDPGTDSVRLTLAQAEEQFLKRNINLFTAQLGISESESQQIQAQLRPNPTVYLELMPYSNGTGYASGATDAGKKAFLPFNQSNSEQVLQIQQLILLAGKRNKQLALAKTNTEIAKDRFQDLIRTLRYQVRNTFYDLHYSQQSVGVYDDEITALQQTVNLYQQQYDKGNVPLKDLARLKAYLFNLTSERQNILLRLTDIQSQMAVLLNVNSSVLVEPIIDAAQTDAYRPVSLNLTNLYQLADENRFDLKGFADQARFEEQNLTLQRALAKPDLTLQGTFDRNGAFGKNYIGIGAGMPIPINNRNQGNIQAAKIRTQSSQQAIVAYRLQVDAEVQRAYAKAIQNDVLYRTFDTRFNQDFAKLIEGVKDNYRKQNIGIVEFLDFLDSYKNSQIQYRQLQNWCLR